MEPGADEAQATGDADFLPPPVAGGAFSDGEEPEPGLDYGPDEDSEEALDAGDGDGEGEELPLTGPSNGQGTNGHGARDPEAQAQAQARAQADNEAPPAAPVAGHGLGEGVAASGEPVYRMLPLPDLKGNHCCCQCCCCRCPPPVLLLLHF